MAKKKSTSKKRSAPAKPARSKPASSIPRKLKQPARELAGVQKEIRQVRSPLYALNRKIKEAPSKYKERKLKKERKEYLAQVEGRLTGLVEKRIELRTQIREFTEYKKEKTALHRKAKRLEKKIDEAASDGNLPVAETLRYELLKALGEIDRLDVKMGAGLKSIDVTKFDREAEQDEGGEGYELDQRSPYAIWEAIKQLHRDLEVSEFEYFIVNGKRFAAENSIQITAEASAFWISSKRRSKGTTPYINRYINFDTKTVKYLYYES